MEAITSAYRKFPLSDYRQLLSLSTPILVGSFSATLTGVVDTALMGRFNVEGLAAVSAGAAIFAVFSNVSAATIVGHQILSAKRFGSEAPEEVGKSFWHSLIFAGGVATLFFLILLVAAPWLIRLVAESDDVVFDAVRYLRARAPALLLFVPLDLLRTTFNSDKQTRWGMYANFVSNGSNILFDIPLIFGFGLIPALGALGNGIGSTLAALVGLIFFVLVANRQSMFRRIRLRSFARDQEELATIIKLVWPAMTSAALDYFANLIFFILIGALGIAHLAGGRIAFNVIIVFFMFTFSLAAGCQIMVGRSWGAKDLNVAQRYRRRNQELMLGILTLLGLPLLIWPQAIISIFTPFEEVKEVTVGAIRVIALSVPLMALTYNNVGVIRGLGKTKWDMYANVLPVWLLQLPIGWFLGVYLGWNLTGIYLGFLAYWIGRGFLARVFAARSFQVAAQEIAA